MRWISDFLTSEVIKENQEWKRKVRSCPLEKRTESKNRITSFYFVMECVKEISHEYAKKLSYVITNLIIHKRKQTDGWFTAIRNGKTMIYQKLMPNIFCKSDFSYLFLPSNLLLILKSWISRNGQREYYFPYNSTQVTSSYHSDKM